MLHMDALAKFKRSTPHLEFPALHKELFSVDSWAGQRPPRAVSHITFRLYCCSSFPSVRNLGIILQIFYMGIINAYSFIYIWIYQFRIFLTHVFRLLDKQKPTELVIYPFDPGELTSWEVLW